MNYYFANFYQSNFYGSNYYGPDGDTPVEEGTIGAYKGIYLNIYARIHEIY